jgi:cell division GTPase FtsZ
MLFDSILQFQVNPAAEFIYNLVDPSANLIVGAVIDQSLTGQVSLEELEISIVIFLYLIRFGFVS